MRVALPSVVLALVVGLVAPASAAPSPGAAGIGDPYFPLDGNGGIDVRKYSVRDAYDFDTGRLRGRTTLRITATQDLSSFHLDLLLPVTSARVDGERARVRKPNRHELRITPREPIAAGETFRVVVRYAGRPGPISYAGESNWLASDEEVVAMNQPHMAPWWFPANDHPRDRALMDVSITVPADRTVVANGTRVSRTVHGRLATTRWRSRDEMVPYLAFFAAGDYRTSQGRYAGRPWFSAVSTTGLMSDPARRREAMRLMRSTPRVLAWLETQIGPYPFETTGGLTTGLPVGFALENQTRPTYPYLGTEGPTTVVHELAHQWYGDSVAVHGWRDIWLNEGFATYWEWAYAEGHGGPPVRDALVTAYERRLPDAGFWQVTVDDPGPQRIFSNPVYERGAMTLAALRTRIGDSAFATLARRWAAERAGGTAQTSDLVALAEEVSGQDLDGFFQVWLRDPQPPARTVENGFQS